MQSEIMSQRSKEDLKDKHWSEILVDEIVSAKKEPYIITGGMTTSGPAHMGTICEFLYPSVIREALENRGKKTDFFFVADIFDAFDSIPGEMHPYADELTPQLGKPLCDVTDPLKCHQSFGEHYLSQGIELMKKMEVKLNLVRAKELYTSGSFDAYTRLYLREEHKVKEVVARTSLRKVEELKDWSPIMPVCADCGKIATTRVTWHDEEEYEYVCDRDVEYTKGCGFKGRDKISNHKYKLQWRLHWPTWQAHFNSSAEASGQEHMTRGSSADTSAAVHKEILNREPPLLLKYGLIMFHGKKYSKSKGIGMGAFEIIQLIPPEVLKYILIVPNLQQNKDLDPTGESLVKLYDEIERVSGLNGTAKARPDEKKLQAFKFSIRKLKWRAPFLDMLLNYQIYRDWGKVGQLLGDKEGVAYLAPFISEWLKKGFEPEQYDFSIKPQRISDGKDLVKKFAEGLRPGMNDLDVHNLVYSTVGDDKAQAKKLFTAAYTAIIGKDNGPRLGKLIAAIGIEKAKAMLNSAAN